MSLVATTSTLAQAGFGENFRAPPSERAVGMDVECVCTPARLCPLGPVGSAVVRAILVEHVEDYEPNPAPSAIVSQK